MSVDSHPYSMRLDKVVVFFANGLQKYLMTDTGLITKDFFKKPDIFVDKYAFAGIAKELKFFITWDKVKPRLIASL